MKYVWIIGNRLHYSSPHFMPRPSYVIQVSNINEKNNRNNSIGLLWHNTTPKLIQHNLQHKVKYTTCGIITKQLVQPSQQWVTFLHNYAD